MALPDKLFPASFRNIPFFSPSESEDGGKKIVAHNYPGSDVRFFEELGTAPPDFSIRAIVHGEDAVENRKRLILAMTEPGQGTLVHPMYGTIQVEALNYSVNSSDTAVGIFNFTLNFGISEQFISLIPDETTGNEVSEASQETREELDNSLVEEYEEPSFIDSVTAVAEEVNAVIDDVNAQIDAIVDPIQDAISDITTIVNTTRRNILTIVRTGDALKSSLRALYESFLVIVEFPSELKEAWEELTDFSFLFPADVTTTFQDSSIIINSTKRNTAKRIQINDNNLVVADHTKINALIGLFESISNTVFDNEEDLLAARKLLENKFVEIVEEAERTSMVFRPSLRARLNNLRNISRTVLDAQEQNVWRVRDADSGISSISVLTHRYYGSLDRLETIKNLNPEQKWSALKNDKIKVVAGGTVN